MQPIANIADAMAWDLACVKAANLLLADLPEGSSVVVAVMVPTTEGADDGSTMIQIKGSADWLRHLAGLVMRAADRRTAKAE